jgi:protein-S-isoprenylcysteine O-methyltransferase Ste14
MGVIDSHTLVIGLAIVVFTWQVVGAARTFSIVQGHPPPRRSQLISLSFVAMLIGSRSVLLRTPLVIAGCIGLSSALALFEWARRSIRGRYFSYIFSDDAPAALVTAGPFAYVRNPFYSSYLLSIVSVAVMLPSLVRWAIAAGMVGYFTAAARHEERKFSTSPFAAEYEKYRQMTGRFIPRLVRAG